MPSFQVDSRGMIKDRLKKPKLYSVVMYNDDYTTMDFVVFILIEIFNRNEEEATKIMLDVHNKGRGIAGIYTYDLAVSKKIQTEQLANEKGFPLRLSLDEIEE